MTVIGQNSDDLSHSDIVWLTIPRLIGIFFNYFLLGILTVQVYVYYLNYKDDKTVFKILVYMIFALEVFQTCSATYDASRWFAYGWGSVPHLLKLYTSFLNIPLLSSTVGTIVQIFFGWRIWTFSRSKFVYVLISILAVAQLGGAVAAAYYLLKYPDEAIHHPGLLYAVGVRLGVSAFADVLIACLMTYFLLRNRTTFLHTSTNAIVSKLIRLTIETGTITATAAILDLVFFTAMPSNTLHQISGVCLSKLYSNSLMIFFNNRVVKTSSSLDDQGVVFTDSLPEGLGLRSNRASKVSVPGVMLFAPAPGSRESDSSLSVADGNRRPRPSSVVV
ncbi:hypothetical protein VNI00_016598 [Paramarasmius palmivorus]|uniref:DUF6534 domain-containing protein n=1 Tax=Paramarasmius palmivorus TaxID=297713 RepID=A0AAW0BC75_9AGAR